ncbi:tetratricopeptide repeat protein [Filomicrobium sp.]|uniref:tetratricopeptide repeat protein n=1 Tax=Filomicrobium sp. TaxID=2024831 RepID=UPI002585EF52|nr:tetratricopeptide repeat protein [Filomicrobium sp.]
MNRITRFCVVPITSKGRNAMRRAISVLGIGILSLWASVPSFAGMQKDLKDCAAANRTQSAGACTRILASGRLPKKQYYIAYFNRGWSHRNADDNAKALADFNRAAKYYPDYSRTYASRALVHNDLGNLEEAVRDLDRAIALNSEDWSAFFSRAVILRKLSRREDALTDLDRSAQLKKDEAKVGILRGLILAELGRFDAAHRQVEDLASTKASKAEVSYVRGVLDLREGNLSNALAHSNTAIDLEPTFTAAYALKGEIMEARGDNAAAKIAYERALSAPPRLLDGKQAKLTAQERVASLTGRLPSGTTAMQNKPSVSDGPLGCRRYIPGASLTIAVACD